MIKPDRVLALRNDRTIFRYADRCAKVYLRRPLSNVLQEAGNMAAAREAGVRTPELFEVTSFEGCWAMVTDYIRGETLSLRMASNNTDCGDSILTLVKAQVKSQSADAGFFRTLKDELGSRIARLTLDERVKDGLSGTLEKLENGNSLCHLDLSPDNLLLQESNMQQVILDWEQSCRGSAAADAASTWLSLSLRYGPKTAEDYLRLYCSASGAVREEIMQWLPLMAAYRLEDCARSERDILLGMINGTQ